MYRGFLSSGPAFKGMQLSFKGIILCGVAGLLIGINQFVCLKFVAVLAYFLFLVGFVLNLIGMFAHVKGMNNQDPSSIAYLAPDIGFDKKYVLCPHCGKAQIRIDSPSYRCPICKKTSNQEMKADEK